MQVPLQQYQLTMSRTERLSSSTNNCPKPKICWYDKTYFQYIILKTNKHTKRKNTQRLLFFLRYDTIWYDTIQYDTGCIACAEKWPIANFIYRMKPQTEKLRKRTICTNKKRLCREILFVLISYFCFLFIITQLDKHGQDFVLVVVPTLFYIGQ